MTYFTCSNHPKGIEDLLFQENFKFVLALESWYFHTWGQIFNVIGFLSRTQTSWLNLVCPESCLQTREEWQQQTLSAEKKNQHWVLPSLGICIINQSHNTTKLQVKSLCTSSKNPVTTFVRCSKPQPGRIKTTASGISPFVNQSPWSSPGAMGTRQPFVTLTVKNQDRRALLSLSGMAPLSFYSFRKHRLGSVRFL